jgi:hypothetical protein
MQGNMASPSVHIPTEEAEKTQERQLDALKQA